MRDPHCVHCGKLITHFGKGYKYSIIKVKGRYCHESCYESYKSSRPKRSGNKKEQNRRYYLKHKDKIKERRKPYQRLWYQRNRLRILNMHKPKYIETDDVYMVKIL